MRKEEITTGVYSDLLGRIANVLVEARTKVTREINTTQVLAYWEIGREIVEFEQKGKARAEYGGKVLIKLSDDLTQKFGRGFSMDNLQLMRRFYSTYPNVNGKRKLTHFWQRKLTHPCKKIRSKTNKFGKEN